MEKETIHVLHVEDNPADAVLFQESLSHAESIIFEVTHVLTAHQAIDELKKKDFDIIISDLHLPDADGVDVVKKLKEFRPRVPIIVMTGSYDEALLGLEARQMGAQDYLSKDKMNMHLLFQSIQYAIKCKRLDQFKDDFISTISHELRTPIAVIELGIENLQDGILGSLSEAQKKCLMRSDRNAKRLKKMIDNLLDLSRLESGRLKIHSQPIQIATVIDQLRDSFSLGEKSSSLLLTQDVPDSFPDLCADPDLINQVFVNLLSNASRYARKEIVIKAEVLSDEEFNYTTARMSVINDGPCIPNNRINDLFGKFIQLDRSTRTDTYKGTGLGLAICKEIITQHHGKIWAENLKKDSVAFHFTLPLFVSQENPL